MKHDEPTGTMRRGKAVSHVELILLRLQRFFCIGSGSRRPTFDGREGRGSELKAKLLKLDRSVDHILETGLDDIYLELRHVLDRHRQLISRFPHQIAPLLAGVPLSAQGNRTDLGSHFNLVTIECTSPLQSLIATPPVFSAAAAGSRVTETAVS